jgi:hypothetical protein
MRWKPVNFHSALVVHRTPLLPRLERWKSAKISPGRQVWIEIGASEHGVCRLWRAHDLERKPRWSGSRMRAANDCSPTGVEAFLGTDRV